LRTSVRGARPADIRVFTELPEDTASRDPAVAGPSWAIGAFPKYEARQPKPADEVTVTVSALDRRALAGTVVEIARQATINASGNVVSTATIALPERDPHLRWGMTVRVELK
jgi:hypothetical protein